MAYCKTERAGVAALAHRRLAQRDAIAALERYAECGRQIGEACAQLERGTAEDLEAIVARQDAELSDAIARITKKTPTV